jgi:hypothetical protein
MLCLHSHTGGTISATSDIEQANIQASYTHFQRNNNTQQDIIVNILSTSGNVYMRVFILSC